MSKQEAVHRRYREFVLIVVLTTLVAALYPLAFGLKIEPHDLTINGVEIGLTRSDVEQILGAPIFEKRTDTGTYGLDYSVSVFYDGSEKCSNAVAIYGDELRCQGWTILKAGQTIEEAERVLGDLLLGVQSESFQDAYLIKGTGIRAVTASSSRKIHSFDSAYSSDP